MPALDPALNQTLWWFLLGAFSGWLLWILIDRLFWRDGTDLTETAPHNSNRLREELLETQREESLLRSQLERAQQENQRLTHYAGELQNRLDGQSEIVASLEVALDAARASGTTSAAAVLSSHAAQSNAQAASAHAARTAASRSPDQTRTEAKPARLDEDTKRQALRELLDQPHLDADLKDLLGSDEELFGAPTGIRTSGSDDTANPDSAPGTTGVYTGPMNDEELDSLLGQDTATLMEKGRKRKKTASRKTELSPSSDPDSAATDLGGHTLTMFDRLRAADSDDPATAHGSPHTQSGPQHKSRQPQTRPGHQLSLVDRLRSAFGGKPSASAK